VKYYVKTGNTKKLAGERGINISDKGYQCRG
jgi:hypothetical protein